MELPSPDELQAAWTELRAIHREYLAVHEVVIPPVAHYKGHTKAVWLAALWHYRNREVHKDEISAIVRRDVDGAAADQQVRHLKRDGWDIGPRAGRHKLNPFEPSQEFLNINARKRMRLAADDFNTIKQAFGDRCATCGAREGQPDPRYGRGTVRLQQGHRDPHEAGNDPDNIIPQCQFCNCSYQSDFVFDDKGRAHAVASINPVRRASAAVQRLILEWLLKREGKR
ncbi:MAG: hypothetical protein OXF74_13395 [Rhodobacteraceae bacterium]|nr:hypothetical protein [Paracoccaceae bacterium]